MLDRQDSRSFAAPAALACALMFVPSRNAMPRSTPPARSWTAGETEANARQAAAAIEDDRREEQHC